MHILVLNGGHSSEREVSLRSGFGVANALSALGHKVTTCDPIDGQEQLTDAAAKVDAIFPILHGRGGEDGEIQSLLELIGKPYLGSDEKASKLCFDKVRLKELLEENDILTPSFGVVNKDNIHRSRLLNHPYVLKPINGGSSIDTFLSHIGDSQNERIASLMQNYDQMLIEELITGTEITVGVLDSEALPVVEIIPPSGQEFDYKNKYNGLTLELCPPKNIGDGIQDRARKIALKVHRLSGCRHISRTDMIVTSSGDIVVLEINTIPGLTNQSLYPKAAQAAGLSMTDLVNIFIKLTKSD